MKKFVNATSPSTRWNTETILVPLDRGMFYLYIRVQLCLNNADRSMHRRMTILKI